MSLETGIVSPKRQRNLFKKYTSCFAAILGKREHIGDMTSSPLKPGVLIYGGNSFLGSKCIYQLKIHEDGWVVSIDYSINTHADVNILISKEVDTETQKRDILEAIEGAMGNHKFDVVLCLHDDMVFGTADSDLVKSMDSMYKENILNSLICTHIAVKYLRRGGLFVLSGSKRGVTPTPEMITYGMSKAAIHHLVKSLAKKDSGMPPESIVVGILPNIQDDYIITSHSKGLVRDLSGSQETIINALQYISDLLVRWTHFKEIPPSGTLCQLNPNGNRIDTILY